MPSDDQLDLQRAADELGVHYQTAYRWVRSGKLPAHVVCSRYVVERSALSKVQSARVAPRAPSPPSARRLAAAADRLHTALVAGDEPGGLVLGADTEVVLDDEQVRQLCTTP